MGQTDLRQMREGSSSPCAPYLCNPVACPHSLPLKEDFPAGEAIRKKQLRIPKQFTTIEDVVVWCRVSVPKGLPLQARLFLNQPTEQLQIQHEHTGESAKCLKTKKTLFFSLSN